MVFVNVFKPTWWGTSSRLQELHSRNRKITTQKDINPKQTPELITKQGFHEFTPNCMFSSVLFLLFIYCVASDTQPSPYQ